jgi:hypothetical protein
MGPKSKAIGNRGRLSLYLSPIARFPLASGIKQAAESSAKETTPPPLPSTYVSFRNYSCWLRNDGCFLYHPA